MQIDIGTRLDGAPGPKYRAALRFAELNPRGGLPKPSKLRTWCPDDELGALRCSLVTPQSLIFDDRGRPHEPTDRSIFDRSISAADALGAEFVVLETGSYLSPSQRDRERFFAYCRALQQTPKCPQLVWRAGGLWEMGDVLEACREHKLWLACDPFADDLEDGLLPQTPELYLQARAEGGTRRFGEDHFIRLANQLEASAASSQLSRVVIALDSPKAFREAARLKNLLEEVGLWEPAPPTP